VDERDTTTTGRDWSLAELVILSKTESAERLVEAVGLPPDRSWNLGDPRKSRGLVEKFSGITYGSRLPRTAELEAHLDDLLLRLAPAKDHIAALAAHLGQHEGRPDALRVWLTQLTSNPSPGYDFPPRQIIQVGEMGAWLGVSLDVTDPTTTTIDSTRAEDVAADGLVAIGAAPTQSTG